MKLVVYFLILIFFSSQIGWAEAIVPLMPGGKSYDREGFLSIQELMRAHQRQKNLIENKLGIKGLRSQAIKEFLEEDADLAKEFGEEFGFVTVQKVTEIVVKDGRIVSIITVDNVVKEDSENKDDTVEEDGDSITPAEDAEGDDQEDGQVDPLGTPTDTDSPDITAPQNSDSSLLNEEDEDSTTPAEDAQSDNHEDNQADLLGAPTDSDAPDRADLGDFHNNNSQDNNHPLSEDYTPSSRTPPNYDAEDNQGDVLSTSSETTSTGLSGDWETITAITDSHLVINSDSTNYREVYEGINQAHQELVTAQKEALDRYRQATKPYYDELEHTLMSNTDLWWNGKGSPRSYFAGSDGALDEGERRKMVATAIYVVSRDFRDDQTDENQSEPAQFHNRLWATQRAQDLLSQEGVLRKEILLPHKKDYEDTLSQIEKHFFSVVNDIVARLQESLILRLQNNLTTILILPANEEVNQLAEKEE